MYFFMNFFYIKLKNFRFIFFLSLQLLFYTYLLVLFLQCRFFLFLLLFREKKKYRLTFTKIFFVIFWLHFFPTKILPVYLFLRFFETYFFYYFKLTTLFRIKISNLANWMIYFSWFLYFLFVLNKNILIFFINF